MGSSATYGRATARGGTAAAARQRRGGSAAAAWQALNSGSVARACACGCACAVCVWTCARAGGRCGCFRALRVPGGGEGPSGYSEPKASFGPLPRLADATFGVGRCCPPRWQARGRVAGKAGRLSAGGRECALVHLKNSGAIHGARRRFRVPPVCTGSALLSQVLPVSTGSTLPLIHTKVALLSPGRSARMLCTPRSR